MKRKTLKKWRKNTRAAGAPATRYRPLVVIDEGPIRAAALKECRKAMRDLEKARRKLEDFERVDQPAFARWYNSTFGPQLSLIREWKEKIEEMERLIGEIEDVRFEQGISYHAAYESVMERRNHPERYGQEREEPRPEEKAEQGRDADEDAERWDPGDAMDDETEGGEITFREFLEFAVQDPVLSAFVGDPGVMRTLYEKLKKDFKRQGGSEKRSVDPPAAKAPSGQDPVKRLYRTLVKRLHPDFRKREDPYDDELWHRVQAAYAQGDVESLETLTALCDIRVDKSFATGSVSSILAVGADQKERLAALKKRMRSAKKDPAWGFAKGPDRAENLEPLIRRGMESALEAEQALYRSCEETVEKWSVARRRKNARRQVVVKQGEFGF